MNLETNFSVDENSYQTSNVIVVFSNIFLKVFTTVNSRITVADNLPMSNQTNERVIIIIWGAGIIFPTGGKIIYPDDTAN